LRADRTERQAKVFHFYRREPGTHNRCAGFAVGMAAVRKAFPHRTNKPLHATEAGSLRRCDVFKEEEAASGFQDAMNLVKDFLGVAYRAEHQRAYNCVYAGIGCGKPFRFDAANVD
jgi:hypothetical protein